MGHASVRIQLPRPIPRWMISLLVIGLLVAVAVAFGSSFLQVYRLKREAARLTQVKQDLIEANAQLREEIKLLHTPGYIERVAREQLGLVKPGEVALLIVRPRAEMRALGPGGPSRVTPDRPSWAARVWRTWLRRLRF